MNMDTGLARCPVLRLRPARAGDAGVRSAWPSRGTLCRQARAVARTFDLDRLMALCRACRDQTDAALGSRRLKYIEMATRLSAIAGWDAHAALGLAPRSS